MRKGIEILKDEWGGAKTYRLHKGKKEFEDFYCEADAEARAKELGISLELKRNEDIVEKLLEKYPEARKDDWVLYGAYLNDYTNVAHDITYAEIMLEHKRLKLASFVSITRCRRKVQARRPELKDPKTAQKREEAEAHYKEFSKIW